VRIALKPDTTSRIEGLETGRNRSQRFGIAVFADLY
jgi:hypothetical protein